MASGHVNRTNRPNTWLHRPTCKREERPCQLGAVHTWHKVDMPGQVLACPLLERSGHPVRVSGLRLPERADMRDGGGNSAGARPVSFFFGLGYRGWQKYE